MNIFKSMAVKDLEEATRAIPVIDFGPAFRGDPGGLDAVAEQVRRASEQVGFFYLAGHGVPQEIVDAALQASREFHAMPAPPDKRVQYRLPRPQREHPGRLHRAQGHPPKSQ